MSDVPPEIVKRVTGVPVFFPTYGAEPWEVSCRDLAARFHVRIPSSSREHIEPPFLEPIPPIGVWRAFSGHPYWLEQLQVLRIEDVTFNEDVHAPEIRASVAAYVRYIEEGFEPPPAEVIYNEPTGRLVTLNRRRVYAAKLAGRETFLAWVGGDPYESMIERARAFGLIDSRAP